MATHLTELRDPLSGRDPQFGKRCVRAKLVIKELTAGENKLS